LVFVYLFPILLAPEFARYALKYGTWAGIFTCLTNTFMLVCLYRVEQCIEDPFDQVGPDEINVGLLRESIKHMIP